MKKLIPNLMILFFNFLSLFGTLLIAYLINLLLKKCNINIINFNITFIVMLFIWFIYTFILTVKILPNKKYINRVFNFNKDKRIIYFTILLFLLLPIYYLILLKFESQYYKILFLVHYVYTALFLFGMYKISQKARN